MPSRWMSPVVIRCVSVKSNTFGLCVSSPKGGFTPSMWMVRLSLPPRMTLKEVS